MKWKKKGLIFSPDKTKWWQQYYAMMPTPVHLKDKKIIRIFFGCTDEKKYGRTTFLDVHEDNPSEIVNIQEEFVIDIGQNGTFDDSGAIPSSIIEVGKEQFLYYVGFQRTQKVPYMLFTGLAIGSNWTSFKKFSESPIIDRSNINVYSNAAPFVLFDAEEAIFKMWFWLAKKWVTVNDKQYLNAEIYYATSKTGYSWEIYDVPCIIPNPSTEFSVGRPWVIKGEGKYSMFYSVRYMDKLYRMAYAESLNGINWDRMDKEIGIDVSEDGWDSEMICYPAVIKVKGKTFMFYNGNNNGETGFGYADLMDTY